MRLAERLRLNRKLLVGCCLLLLPAAVSIALGVFFLVDRVPKIDALQARAVTAGYRRYAAELVEHPERATYVGPRGEKWTRVGQFGDRKVWGRVPYDGGQLVWVGDMPKKGTPRGQTKDAVVIGQRVESLEPACMGTFFRVAVPLVLLLIVFLTGFGIFLLVRSSAERDDFLAATAHDLTTPLVGLRGMIGVDDEEARALNERLIRLVANIRDFLRLGGCRKTPACGRVNLSDAFRSAYAVFREDYRDVFDGADLSVREPSEGVFARADEEMVVQILWNLLGNELKYAAPYGRVGAVVSRAGGWATVDLFDAGPGMTARQRRHAFDRYYRAKSARESGKGGFGIGLCTSREFARAMGGDLLVAPARTGGCVFTLRLPAADEPLV